MDAFSFDLLRRELDAALARRRADRKSATSPSGFGVSGSFVQKLERRWRNDGTAQLVGHRGGAPPKLSDARRTLLVEGARRLRPTGRLARPAGH